MALLVKFRDLFCTGKSLNLSWTSQTRDLNRSYFAQVQAKFGPRGENRRLNGSALCGVAVKNAEMSAGLRILLKCFHFESHLPSGQDRYELFTIHKILRRLSLVSDEGFSFRVT